LPPISYLPTSGGQLRDQTVHFFDLLRWISEDEPEEVYVFGAALVDPKVAEVGDIDTSVVAIRLSCGTLCQIDCSRRTGYGYDERIEAFGSKGLVESCRQRAPGVSRYIGDKIIEDGLHAGWFERIEQSYSIESVRAHTKQDIVAVGSRSKDRAEEFASRMALQRAYGNYQELVAADDLDVIYVATPHNMHHEGSRWHSTQASTCWWRNRALSASGSRIPAGSTVSFQPSSWMPTETRGPSRRPSTASHRPMP
jgi:predicted dehydrogenase